MGMVYTAISLTNFADQSLYEDGYLPIEKIRTVNIKVLADSGAIRLVINEHIREKLGLKIRHYAGAQFADGRTMQLPIAGPVKISFENRECITEAFVLPGDEEPLLGAVPMELMDLVIIPKTQRIICNPAHPDGVVLHMKYCLE
jgi:clan AA aspartic protease